MIGPKRNILLCALAMTIGFAQSSSAVTYTGYTVKQRVVVQPRPVVYRQTRVVYRTTYYRTYYVKKDKSGIEKAGKSTVGLADRSTKICLGGSGKAVKETLKAVF